MGSRFFQTHLRVRQESGASSRQRELAYGSIQASLSLEGEGLTVQRKCYLLEVSRAGFYRFLQRIDPQQEEVLLRKRLQQLAVAQKRLCGYRPLTALLRREGTW